MAGNWLATLKKIEFKQTDRSYFQNRNICIERLNVSTYFSYHCKANVQLSPACRSVFKLRSIESVL
ncbi:hypothetical protein BIW11_02492 [Tropilaelaps mercedesae]|uniref:Uncharacterized protein n=1 Tax=Tropilaelaps mercedesae TaxID=418985 RepID=A0A1V9Y2E0_9ACAR|nr:hypothetical protein BIW11_02492 [Tropilaelaps mercedesae]